jgi:cell division protein FtsB
VGTGREDREVVRNIGERIRRYRLSRYGHAAGIRLRWAWPLLFLWWVYAVLLGEHSLLSIWRMSQENQRLETEWVATRTELDRLERQLRDPREKKRMAERALRERSGWARPGEIIYRVPNVRGDSASR